jgi:hypothetical protein
MKVFRSDHDIILRRTYHLLSNGSVNTFQQTGDQQYRSGVFCGPCCAHYYAAGIKYFSTIMNVFFALWVKSLSIPFVKWDIGVYSQCSRK